MKKSKDKQNQKKENNLNNDYLKRREELNDSLQKLVCIF